MPTTFVKGDFLAETPLLAGARVFAFAADVSGSLERGISIAVRKRWPLLAEWWTARANGKPKTDVGTASKWKGGTDVVYALGTERSGARPKLSWLENSVRAMLADAAKSGHTQISVARLWGGPGGLDGDRAKRVLDDLGEASPVTLVVFEQFVRAKAPSESAAGDAEESEATGTDDLDPLALDDPPAKKKKKATPKKKAAPAKKKATAAKKPAAKKPVATKKAPAKKAPKKKASK